LGKRTVNEKREWESDLGWKKREDIWEKEVLKNWVQRGVRSGNPKKARMNCFLQYNSGGGGKRKI